eukprot:275524-Pleurochrysis_carterae.AAC.4
MSPWARTRSHFSQLACAASSLDSASSPATSAAAPAAARPPHVPRPTQTNATAACPAPRTQCTRLCLPTPARPSPGDMVFIPKQLWPAYACHKHGGRGWTGYVMSFTKRSALIALSFALDDHGRRYAPAQIPHADVEDLGCPLTPRWRYAQD